MKKNKIYIYGTILIVLVLILVPSLAKVVKKHQDYLLQNTIKTITETAKDCYYNDSCVGDIIYLSELYEKTSLTTMSNPLTKKIYSENSYIDVKNDFTFVEVD